MVSDMTHRNNARHTSTYYQKHKDELRVKHEQRRETKRNKRIVLAEFKELLGIENTPPVIPPNTYEHQCKESGVRFSVHKKNVVITF